MAAKFPTTNRDVKEPFTRRTADTYLIGAESYTIYFRRTVKGEPGVWIGATDGIESKGAKTLDTAADAAIEARKIHNALNAASARIKADAPVDGTDVPAPEVGTDADAPAPVKSKSKGKEKSKGKGKKGKASAPVTEVGTDVPAETAPVESAPAEESVSLAGVTSDVPLTVQLSEDVAERAAKTREAVKNGTAIKAPKAAPPMNARKIAALVDSEWRQSAAAVTRFREGTLSEGEARSIILRVREEMSNDVARALLDGVDMSQVVRLRDYGKEITGHHLAVVGGAGSALTPARSTRIRKRLNGLIKRMAPTA